MFDANLVHPGTSCDILQPKELLESRPGRGLNDWRCRARLSDRNDVTSCLFIELLLTFAYQFFFQAIWAPAVPHFWGIVYHRAKWWKEPAWDVLAWGNRTLTAWTLPDKFVGFGIDLIMQSVLSSTRHQRWIPHTLQANPSGSSWYDMADTRFVPCLPFGFGCWTSLHFLAVLDGFGLMTT